MNVSSFAIACFVTHNLFTTAIVCGKESFCSERLVNCIICHCCCQSHERFALSVCRPHSLKTIFLSIWFYFSSDNDFQLCQVLDITKGHWAGIPVRKLPSSSWIQLLDHNHSLDKLSSVLFCPPFPLWVHCRQRVLQSFVTNNPYHQGVQQRLGVQVPRCSSFEHGPCLPCLRLQLCLPSLLYSWEGGPQLCLCLCLCHHLCYFHCHCHLPHLSPG